MVNWDIIPVRAQQMHEDLQDQPVSYSPLGPAWSRRALMYCALLSLFLTIIPVRSFGVDFSGHHTVRVHTGTQKRLVQASDASRFSAPARKVVPAPRLEPVVYESRPQIPLFVVHFERSRYNRPPPVA